MSLVLSHTGARSGLEHPGENAVGCQPGLLPSSFGGFWLSQGAELLVTDNINPTARVPTGSRAGKSRHTAHGDSTSRPSRCSRPPFAHSTDKQKPVVSRQQHPRPLTSEMHSLRFVHHQVSCQRSPGARLVIATLMSEPEIARRSVAGSGGDGRLIYKHGRFVMSDSLMGNGEKAPRRALQSRFPTGAAL